MGAWERDQQALDVRQGHKACWAGGCGGPTLVGYWPDWLVAGSECGLKNGPSLGLDLS